MTAHVLAKDPLTPHLGPEHALPWWGDGGGTDRKGTMRTTKYTAAIAAIMKMVAFIVTELGVGVDARDEVGSMMLPLVLISFAGR